MRSFRRLLHGERGQVLYLTLVMTLVLALFSLVLANTAYLVVMKVRAQDLADAMALSGATLQARLLNRITNLNGILYGGVTAFGENQVLSYSTGRDLGKAYDLSQDVLHEVESLVTDQRDQMNGRMGSLLRSYGWDESRLKVKVHSVRPENHLFANLRKGHIAGSDDVGLPVMPSIEIRNTPWCVQSRVEFMTRDALIGGRLLRADLPDIVTRARAQVLDHPAGSFTASWNHHWKVRLVQPDEALDAHLRGSPATVETTGEPVDLLGKNLPESERREEP